MKPIAVLGCQLQLLPPTTGVVTITSTGEPKTLIDNKPAFFGNIAFTVAGASTTGATGGSGGGAIMGTAAFTSDNNLPAVLMGDHVTVTLTGTTTSTPPSPISWPAVVQVIDAGQTSTMAE